MNFYQERTSQYNNQTSTNKSQECRTQKDSLTLPPISPSHYRCSSPKDSEELIFFNDNEHRLKAYKNYIQNKMSSIDARAENYLSYMYHFKHQRNKTNENNAFTSPTPKKGLNNSYDDTLFTPGYVKSKQSDITNPNYFATNSYNNLMKKKKEYLNYNYINSEKNYMNRKKHFNSDDNLIPNPYNDLHCNVYTLGSSSLQHNPILNPIPNFEYNRYLNRNIYLK